jgi:antitoxin component HigA of HigAB toxin-antitoxin module
VNDVQIIKTHGEDLVVLSRRDYDALLARAGDEAAEDAMSLRILAETKAQTALPADVMDRIIDGENPIAVLLEHRGLTQAALARVTGLSQPFISKLVRGDVGGRRDTMEKLRIALRVSADVLPD